MATPPTPRATRAAETESRVRRCRCRRRRLAGLQHKPARTLENGLQIRHRQGSSRKLDEITLLQESLQQRAMPRQRLIRSLRQPLQKLLGGPLSRDYTETPLYVIPDHFRSCDPELPCSS